LQFACLVSLNLANFVSNRDVIGQLVVLFDAFELTERPCLIQELYDDIVLHATRFTKGRTTTIVFSIDRGSRFQEKGHYGSMPSARRTVQRRRTIRQRQQDVRAILKHRLQVLHETSGRKGTCRRRLEHASQRIAIRIGTCILPPT